jgi:hypothetical protein
MGTPTYRYTMDRVRAGARFAREPRAFLADLTGLPLHAVQVLADTLGEDAAVELAVRDLVENNGR